MARGNPPPKERLREAVDRGTCTTLYGRDAAVVEFDPREPLDPESHSYIVALVVNQGELEAWCKQMPSGRACPSMGNRGAWCKHAWAGIVLWQEALEG